MTVTGLVVAAGSSRRFGSPKQLAPYGGATLLDATLDVARACGFDQLLVTLGAAEAEIRAAVDLAGTTVVVSEQHADGCSSSVRTAVDAVVPYSAGVVLLVGDQPGIRPTDVAVLVAASRDAPLGVCRYQDGLGHPLWLGREVFDDLRTLRGDKAVWGLLDGGPYDVVEVGIDARIPRDVDTLEDHARLLAEEGSDRG